MNYVDYLQIKNLLSCQKMESERLGKPAHDEMLFIIVHQVYELWFKQILFEVDSVMEIFEKERVNEEALGLVAHRLQRVVTIQKHIVDQIAVLETMTPLDFLEFRDLLVPASGFQSFQFRLLETRLGLRSQDRVSFAGKTLDKAPPPEEESKSLFVLIDRWLSRTPFLKMRDFDFLKNYKVCVDKMLLRDKGLIEANPSLSPDGKQRQLVALETTRQNFEALFDRSIYDKLLKSSERRMSYDAALASLLIFLYRDRPIFQQPFHVLTALVDMDEWFTTWRYRHSLMVHRMIGTKIGTGGSSGHDYLKRSANQHKVFTDLFDLSTFLIPRSQLPSLPQELQRKMDFVYSSEEGRAS